MRDQKTTLLNIWAERLALIDIIYFLSLSIVKRICVRYDEHKVTFISQFILHAFRKTGIAKMFIPAGLSLDRKNNEGYSITYHLYEVYEDILQTFSARYLNNFSKSYRITAQQYLYQYIFNRFVFLVMAETAIGPKPYSDNAFYVVRHPLNHVFISYYRKKGISISQSIFSWESCKYYLRPFYLFLRIIVSLFDNTNIKGNPCKDKPTILIEYCDGLFEDFSFWRTHVNLDKINIVYYLDRNDDPAIDRVSKDMNARGFSWIDLHFYSLLQLGKIKIKAFFLLIYSFINVKLSLPFWFRVFQFERTMWFLFYQSAFRRLQAKVIIQHQEVSWVQEVQSEAIESVGGIMIGFHWSNYPFQKVPMLSPRHVSFVWGKIMHDLFRDKEGSSRYILPSGLWLLPKRDGYLDLGLFPDGTDFVIAILDNTFSYNTQFSMQTIATFYSKVLDLLKKNITWGGIIKSKYYNLHGFKVFPEEYGIYDKLHSLIKQNRLKVLDPAIPPFVASSHAHLSVCCGLATVGVLAGIYGNKFIQWDSVGCLRHPFYEDKEQKFTYSDFESFEQAIVDFYKGNGEIGDFSKWRKMFNHFDDFLADKRVGNFIQTFLDQNQKYQDVSKALDYAVAQYINGNSIASSFFKTDNFYHEDKHG